jgi:lipopolysaccharide transport system ATP-binding protein
VGTGFHPELTGRENIYLYGSILGMRRADINRRFHDIVAFAEVEPFLELPVKRYSSGMYVRLAFAVAAHLDTEILLVDEVLAVGDANFQQRCLQKMDSFSRSGRTVLVVSHNLSTIRARCQRAVVLDAGCVVGSGPADEQVAAYLAGLAQSAAQPLGTRVDREGNGRTRLTHVRFTDEDGHDIEHGFPGVPLRVVIGYRSAQVGHNPVLMMSFFSSEGQKVFHLDNRSRGTCLPALSEAGEYVCTLTKLPLTPGRYHINVLVNVGNEITDHVYSAALLEVLPADFYGAGRETPSYGGLVFVEHEWN